MSVLLAEPFLLASYPTPSRKSVLSGGANYLKRPRYVSATCSTNGHGEAFVTVSVEGDGVHILELSSLHALVSHTLGPSAYFMAPAVTRFDRSDVSISYAVMQSGSAGINAKDSGWTVWRWHDSQSMRPEESAEEKHSAVFPRRMERMWAPSSLPSHVIAVSPSGEVMVSDAELKVTSSKTLPGDDAVLLKSWVFESDECTFLRRRRDQLGGMVMMCFVMVGQQLKLRMTLVASTGELKDISECDLEIHENVIDISCDTSGYISIFTQRGEWQFLRLDYRCGESITAVSLDGPLCLTGLSLPTFSGSADRVMTWPSLLSVGSSHVLLAGVVDKPSPEVVLLLWDLQYSVVLASQTLALPSTLACTPESPPDLELVLSSRTQALLVISPTVSVVSLRNSRAPQCRCSIYVVPLAIPPTSTIALAMGKAHESRKWVLDTGHHLNDADQDQGRSQMMRTALEALEQGQPQAAETVFFAWVKEETIRLKLLQKMDVPNHRNESDVPDRSSFPVADGYQRKPSTKPALSHHFVSNVLTMVMQPSKAADIPYSSKIILYLVGRKAVAHSMVQGGLLPSLRRRNDWESINSTIQNVPDIPESDLIKLLADIAAFHRQRRDLVEEGMQVDAQVDMPPLPQFLGSIVAYATSPPMLRLALKQYLNDTRDVACVLEVLEGWVSRWCKKGVELRADLGCPPVDMSQPYPRIHKKKLKSLMNGGLPPFETVLSFLRSVLDTHFLSLLQYSLSHKIIERLMQHLRLQLISIDELERLRGPLESFARRELKQTLSGREENEGDRDWRKKRRGPGEIAQAPVGLYQIEELII